VLIIYRVMTKLPCRHNPISFRTCCVSRCV